MIVDRNLQTMISKVTAMQELILTVDDSDKEEYFPDL